jgi:hypothetical protein
VGTQTVAADPPSPRGESRNPEFSRLLLQPQETRILPFHGQLHDSAHINRSLPCSGKTRFIGVWHLYTPSATPVSLITDITIRGVLARSYTAYSPSHYFINHH